ncbi:MAG: hypothetical protein JXQ99_21195 [Hyphomicrobiaceae bacterium]
MTNDFEFDHATSNQAASKIVTRRHALGHQAELNQEPYDGKLSDGIEWDLLAMVLRVTGIEAFAQTMAGHLPTDPEAPMRRAMCDTVLEAAKNAGNLDSTDWGITSPYLDAIDTSQRINYSALARIRLALGDAFFLIVLSANKGAVSSRH